MAWVELRGKKYRGMYRDANKRSRTAGWSTSKREALKLAQEEEHRIRHGIWRDPSAGKMLFSEYFEGYWLRTRVREKNTIRTYQSHYNSTLKATYGHIEVRRISPQLIQQWITERLGEGISPGTIRAHYRTLSTVLGARKGSSAVRDGLIANSPCDGIELPPVESRDVVVYSVPEVDLLMTEIADWWQPLPILAADSGLRWGELMGLYVSDFTVGFRSVHVRRALLELTKADTGNGTPFPMKSRLKNGKHRFVALSPEVSSLIATMVQERDLMPEDRLFSMEKDGKPVRTPEWPNGCPVGRSYFREYVWKPAHLHAGLWPRRFHDLRGSHITWLLGGNADIATVMKRVGHSQLSTTQLYVAALEDADERALDALARMRAKYRPQAEVPE